MTGEQSNGYLVELRDVCLGYGGSGIRLPLVHRDPKLVVHDASFGIQAGETFALVGESGSGKTTIARAIGGMLAPLRGQIYFEGNDIARVVERRSRELKREIQFVFQNPDSSLNPRRRVSYSIGRPLEMFFGLSGAARRRRVEELLNDVDLPPDYADRLPAQLSGGERQRIAIARALAAQPKLVLCDEVVSALDVSVRANVLELLGRLQQEMGFSYLFIAHDLAVVRWLAHRVAVIYLGQMLEIGTSQEVFSPPFHPYTEMLMRAVPEPDPTRPCPALSDTSLLVTSLESGTSCPFSPRCEHKEGLTCEQVPPPWQAVTPTHTIRCHLPLQQLAELQEPLVARLGNSPANQGGTS